MSKPEQFFIGKGNVGTPVGGVIRASVDFIDPKYMQLPVGGAGRVDLALFPELNAALGYGNTPATIYSKYLEATINNPTPASYDYFGQSCSMNSAGDRMVIGANMDNTGVYSAGSAYVYLRTGTVWSLEATINNPTPALNDYFGQSCSMNSAGDRMVIGANQDNTGASNAGSAYVYLRTGTVWSLEATINNPTPDPGDRFGYSCSMNSAGDRMVIGANQDSTGDYLAGSAYVYTNIANSVYIVRGPYSLPVGTSVDTVEYLRIK